MNAKATSATSAEDPRISKVIAEVEKLLVPGETIQAYSVQRRIFALSHRRTIILATSGRFIAINRGLIGGMDMKDVRWQDTKESKLRESVLGSDLTLVSINGSDLATSGQSSTTMMFTGLRKEQTRTVYRICQTSEQAWREKRRVREIEELRAKSGGIQLGAMPSPIQSGTGDKESPTARLARAKEMLNSGLINDSEFESLKAKIIAEV